MSTTIQKLAQEIVNQFTSSTRDNGETFYHLIDGSPEWMTDVIHEAHGNTLPDDTVYEFVRDAVYALAEADEDADTEELREAIYELEPEYRNYHLLQWAARWSEYIDQAISEFGAQTIESSSDFFTLLQSAQKCQIDEIGNAVINALESLADERNAESEDEDEDETDE